MTQRLCAEEEAQPQIDLLDESLSLTDLARSLHADQWQQHESTSGSDPAAAVAAMQSQQGPLMQLMQTLAASDSSLLNGVSSGLSVPVSVQSDSAQDEQGLDSGGAEGTADLAEVQTKGAEADAMLQHATQRETSGPDETVSSNVQPASAQTTAVHTENAGAESAQMGQHQLDATQPDTAQPAVAQSNAPQSDMAQSNAAQPDVSHIQHAGLASAHTGNSHQPQATSAQSASVRLDVAQPDADEMASQDPVSTSAVPATAVQADTAIAAAHAADSDVSQRS